MSTPSRIVSGLAAPWDRVGKRALTRWSFRPGALYWDDPIRLLVDHDKAARIGLVLGFDGEPAGLRARGYVRPCPAGDAALARVDAGRAAYSAGLEDIEYVIEGDGVHVATRARLAEVSIVKSGAMPGTQLTRGEG